MVTLRFPAGAMLELPDDWPEAHEDSDWGFGRSGSALPSIAPSPTIYLHSGSTDMRRSFDGLSSIIRGTIGSDPTDGSLFLFVNRRRDRIKALRWDGDRYVLPQNRMFIGSVDAGSRAADLLSLVSGAKHNGLDVFPYVNEVDRLLAGKKNGDSPRGVEQGHRTASAPRSPWFWCAVTLESRRDRHARARVRPRSVGGPRAGEAIQTFFRLRAFGSRQACSCRPPPPSRMSPPRERAPERKLLPVPRCGPRPGFAAQIPLLPRPPEPG